MIRIFIFHILFALSIAGSTEINELNGRRYSQEPEIRFGVLADVQYCECESVGSRHYSESLNKLNKAVEEFNKYPLDFVISLGDLIDRNYKSFDTVLQVLEGCNADVFHSIGNHDQDVEQQYKDSVLYKLKLDKGYYSFSKNSYRFIILNTYDININSSEQDKKEQAEQLIEKLSKEGAINAHSWNGGIGKDQIRWLIDELVTASNARQKVIIFSHHPIWPQSTLNLLNYMELLDIISCFDNIIGWFSGHKHDGGYGNVSKTHCVNFKAMVETESQNAFSMVDIYSNKIWIKGYGREKSQILAY